MSGGGEAFRNTADHLLAAGDPAAVAVVDGDREVTYGALRADAAVLAARLRALGLPPGARVGLLGPNSPFWIAGYLALLKLGLVAVPLSDKRPPDDVRRDLDQVHAAAVLVDRRLLRRLPAGLDLPVLTDEAIDETTAVEGYWPPAGPCDPDADAVLMFTSGTTARPKAVRITHRNLQANTASILAYLDLRADDRALVVLPFFYCFGASVLHTHLRVGARLVLCHTFALPQSAVDLIGSAGCTVLAGVPSSFHLLLRATTLGRRPEPSLRIVQQAGGRLAPELLAELAAAQPSARVFVMYGQTEATARLAYLPPEELARRPGSIGRAVPGVELRVLDEEGRPVPPGVRGEIYARGENVSPGYLDDPDGTAAKFTPHGLRTGDLAVTDDEGFLTVVDRREDFIKSWGHRLSSHEIEAGALAVPGVLSAAAVGVPDPRAGEAVTLFVAPLPGQELTADGVLAVLRSRLPRHLVPRSVVVLDRLPLTDSGKVAKPALRELALATAAGGVG